MRSPDQRPCDPRAVVIGIIVGVLLVVGLTVACFWNYYPPVASTQHFTVEFDRIQPGTSDPLIVTGEKEAGDFLYVKFVGPDAISIGYDRWGSGGPVSEPVHIRPDGPQRLDLQLPSLVAVRGNRFATDTRLRVAVNGQTVLDTMITPNPRKPMRLWFAMNPLGGSSCGAELHGKLRDNDGRVLAGNIREVLTRSERFRGWLRYGVFQPVAILVLGTLGAWLVATLGTVVFTSAGAAGLRAAASAKAHRAFLVSALLCAVVFGWFVTCGSGRFWYEDSFGVFYDAQAQSLLNGRLDVPGDALSGEAFIAHGKTYGYFGVTPALLRTPFAIFGLGYGKLTRSALFVAFCGTLLGAYLVLRQALRIVRPQAPEPGAALTIFFTVNVGLGSTLFFLGSRAYIYHEAIAWGILFGVFACWYVLRQIANPGERHWLAAILCGLLSLHARPPTGLYALTIVMVTALWFAVRRRRELGAVARMAGIAAACVAAIFSFNVLSYLKFGTFEGCPLRLNVQYNAERLAKIDGKQFHLVNIPYVAFTYFVGPGLGTTHSFPWIAFKGAKDGKARAMAKMDMTDSTAAIPAAMAGLSFLALIGGSIALARARSSRTALALIWVSAVPLTGAMCAAIATSQRYTGDFLPFLIAAAAIGGAGLALLQTGTRRVASGLFAAATAWSVAAMVAVTLQFQGEMVWGLPDGVQSRYQHLRETVNRWTGQASQGTAPSSGARH